MNQPIPSRLNALLGRLYQRINYEAGDRPTPASFKLANMRRLLDAVGNPQQRYPIVHVAGTKGKGSVCMMAARLLRATGRRVGLYTSPHLEAFQQRIQINGRPIDDDLLCGQLERIEHVAAGLDADPVPGRIHRPLTFFEITTAVGFACFAELDVDAAVIEVGMGGRLDSTNVCLPEVSVITSISLDHTAQLGSTLAAIAGEKAGIIKPGVPVVSGVTAPEPAEVIREVAAREGAPLWELESHFHLLADSSSIPCEFAVEDPRTREFRVVGDAGGSRLDTPPLQIGLLGAHQQRNAALALAALWCVPSFREGLSADTIREGLADLSLPGRLERVVWPTDSGDATLLLDIAHNPASIEALVTTLQDEVRPGCPGRLRLVFACSADKDATRMLGHLVPVFEQIWWTRFLGNPRARAPESLAQIASEFGELAPGSRQQVVADPKEALAAAVDGLQGGDLVVVTGSVFLIAELRGEVLRGAALGDPN